MADPVLQIELPPSSGPLHIVTADQLIAGKVTFSNIQERPTVIVTISLIGVSETAFAKGRTAYYGKATLFQLSTTLHDGHLPQRDYEWPFEFTFPKVTAGEKKKWLDVTPFQVNEGHPLPPSMFFNAEGPERSEGKGGVIYYLEASFAKSSKSSIFTSAKNASLPVFYIPCRKVQTPGPQIASVGKESFTCSSKLLDPKAEKPKSFLKRFKTPHSVFQVAVTAPHVIYSGGPIPIMLSLTHDLQNSTAPEPPTIIMTSCTIALIRTMSAVGRAIFEDSGKFTTLEILYHKENLDIALSPSQNLSELFSYSELQSKLSLSYGTYNLAAKFKFRVKITLECVGEKFWTELYSPRPVHILSPFTKETFEKGDVNVDPASFAAGMNNINTSGNVSTLR